MSIDISQLTSSLPLEERKVVQAEYKRRAKDSTTAFLLCFFLGMFGAHCFYLGRVGQGIFRLVISPLIVPGLIWEIVDLLRIDGVVHARNLKLAEELVASAMLAAPNSAALAAALAQLDSTLPQRPAATTVPVPALQLASVPDAASDDLASATAHGTPAAEAHVAETDLSAFQQVEPVSPPAPAVADHSEEQTLRDVHASDADAQTDRTEPVAAPHAHEWAPQWPIEAAGALAAELALAEGAAATTAPESAPPAAADPDADATLAPWHTPPAEPDATGGAASPRPVEEVAAESRIEQAPWSDAAAGAWDTPVSADDAPGADDPGTAALAFGWLEAATTPNAPHQAPVSGANGGTVAPFAAETADAALGGDPTDRSLPTLDSGSTADIGELGSVGRVTVALTDDAQDAPNQQEEWSGWVTAPAVAPATDLAPDPLASDASGEPEAQPAVLVFVADDTSEPALSLAGDAAPVASTAAEPARLEAATLPSGAVEDQAPFSDKPSTEPAASDAEPARTIKRVRVVRRLLVNGQVVRETSAEQVIAGNEDASEAAASLQRTLGSADPATLRALAADMELTLPATAQAPASPVASPVMPSSDAQGAPPTNQ